MAEFTNTTLQGVGITFMILTNLVCLLRIWARVGQSPRFRADDAWLMVAYVFYMVTTIAFLVNGPSMFRLMEVRDGAPPYPGYKDEVAANRVLFFFAPIGFWFTLWSVKSSLLSFYKKMMIQLPLHIQLWWAVIVYCVLALAATLAVHIMACGGVGGWFVNGKCTDKGTNNSVWVQFAMDVSSDFMIMLLPLTLVRNLQMTFTKKISLGLLFGLAGFVIISAIIRAIQITEHSFRPKSTWVALWSIIEFSVALIVGCGPGLYFSKHPIPLFSPANRLPETSP